MTNKIAIAISIFLLASSLPAQRKEEDRNANRPFFEKEAKKGDGTTRPIRGVVKDGKDQPVQGALVTLLNKETKRAMSVTTGRNGDFLFDECKKNVDFELRAEYKRAKAPARLVSAYNPAAKPFIELRLEEPQVSTKK